jgi:hypothetical protein
MLHSILKIAHVRASVSPFVLAKAFRLTWDILSNELVTIVEKVTSIAMPEVLVPLALILVFVFPDMDTVAWCFPLDPLANVGVATCTAPDPIAIFLTVLPFAVVYLTIGPCVNTFAVGFAELVRTMVNILVSKFFVAMAVPFIIKPLSFVDSAARVDDNAVAW